MTNDVVSWALSQEGNGYCWGGTGVVCTPSYRKRLAEQYPAQAENLLGVCAKWDGKPVYDCAQFVKAALKRAGITLVSGATSQYKQSGVWGEGGPISGIPGGVLAVIWRESNDTPGTFGHVGLRLPDGSTIEAMDSQNGVVRRSSMAAKWTHYKLPKGLKQSGNSDTESAQDTNTESTPGTVTVVKKNVYIRKQPKIVNGSNHNRICTLPDNYTASIIERHDGWTRIPYLIHKGWVRDDMLQFND